VVLIRVMLRPHREPASRLAWVAAIAAVPLLGLIAYILFGEIHLGHRQARRLRRLMARMPKTVAIAAKDIANVSADVPLAYQHLFRVGFSVNGFPAIGGNQGRLLSEPDETIEQLVQDIDAATQHVHLLFYIWLEDGSGMKIVEALHRAAGRGVTCRAMADALGSRGLVRSAHWESMRMAGVRLAVAFPLGNPLLAPFLGRIDHRNHRKIVVIDSRITYCGSRNCADADFHPKPAYAPWVDAMVRLEGPIAAQNLLLFAADWTAWTDEDLQPLLREPTPAPAPGFVAQVIGTGPTVRYSAMPEVFEAMIYAARRELTVTTPYYVPEESLQSALCAAAHRGVDVRIVFPESNDSWLVGAASRSYYAGLLDAGVRIFEYPDGLLHAKTLTIDGQVTLIGSANMDRRSFDLNFENNILYYDPSLTSDLRARQQEYLDVSHEMTREEVAEWSIAYRLWNNSWATLGPIL